MTLGKKIVLALMAAAMLLTVFVESLPAAAAEKKHDMAAMTSDNPADQGYTAAMKTMDEAMMAMKLSGNADVDFVQNMIPHHQAAIDMAKVMLQYGKDAEMRKLAQDIISAQETEIKQMQDWLAAHPVK